MHNAFHTKGILLLAESMTTTIPLAQQPKQEGIYQKVNTLSLSTTQAASSDIVDFFAPSK